MDRLKKRTDFLAIAKTGRRCVTPAFILQSRPSPSDGPVRLGLTASRKVGGAVERNRAKRRLRALARHILPLKGQPGTDYVLIARQESLRRDFAAMRQDLEKALKKV